MIFNPDPFQIHSTISVNNNHAERSSYQKHLGILLDEKFNFIQHIDCAICQINKGISVTNKLRHSLPLKSLFIMAKFY